MFKAFLTQQSLDRSSNFDLVLLRNGMSKISEFFCPKCIKPTVSNHPDVHYKITASSSS